MLRDHKPGPVVAITGPPLPSSRSPSNRSAEHRLRWKIVLRTVPVVAVLYALCTINHVNIGNARLAGLKRSLNLHGNDVNALLLIPYVLCILFSVPATWLTK
jgi:hypothetical protein